MHIFLYLNAVMRSLEWRTGQYVHLVRSCLVFIRNDGLPWELTTWILHHFRRKANDTTFYKKNKQINKEGGGGEKKKTDKFLVKLLFTPCMKLNGTCSIWNKFYWHFKTTRVGLKCHISSRLSIVICRCRFCATNTFHFYQLIITSQTLTHELMHGISVD